MSASAWNDTNNGFGRDDRDLELLAAYALGAVEPDEERELERLLAQDGRDTLESLELAAAAAAVATANIEPMPASVRTRLRASGQSWARGAPARNPAAAEPVRTAPVAPARDNDGGTLRIALWSGWLAAAACLAIAAVAWLPVGSAMQRGGSVAAGEGWLRAEPGMSQAALAETRSELVVREGDTVLAAWTPTERPDPTATGAGGDVIWSTAEQCGVMRFAGLAPNDPEEFQYQLWIFDETQEHPIDGGVFDVPADGSGEVFVAVNPKLGVERPTMFAVTVEKPGGVVVSDRSRIALLAPEMKPISECSPKEIAGQRG